ncbi:unnamed protein product [Jaminaea pallidilutea]
MSNVQLSQIQDEYGANNIPSQTQTRTRFYPSPSPIMSQASWRQFFSYNRYTSICGRATRSALKESERVQAERRGETSLRYQEWKDGKATDPMSIHAQKQQQQ